MKNLVLHEMLLEIKLATNALLYSRSAVTAEQRDSNREVDVMVLGAHFKANFEMMHLLYILVNWKHNFSARKIAFATKESYV